MEVRNQDILSRLALGVEGTGDFGRYYGKLLEALTPTIA